MTTGGCVCGNVKYEYSGEPVVRALCHCTDCQNISGGAFTSNVVVPRTAFRVTKGTPKTWDVIGDSGKNNKRFFCDNCGSGLFTELDVMPDVTCVKAGGLDGPAAQRDHKVDVEYYVKDRVPYLGAVQGADQKPAFG